VAEQCGGTAGQTCPSDGFAAANVVCDADGDVCSLDACDDAGACVFDSVLDCEDGNACTQDSCDPLDGCESSGTPALTCAPAAKSLLKIKDASSNRKDGVRFLWKGGPLLVPDMGDPTQTTRYELCVYDTRGVQMTLGVPPGAGWTVVGPIIAPKGFKYLDTAAQADGIRLIKTKGSSLDKAKLKVAGKGDNLPDTAALPLQYPVTAQLYASDGMCWEAEFTQAETRKNEVGAFIGRAP
jgi:hypothetical protein